MTALWPSDGHRREEGREAAQKQPGEEWWRWSGMLRDGARGMQHAAQLRTATSGKMLSRPYVPSGTERIKVKVRLLLLSLLFYLTITLT